MMLPNNLFLGSLICLSLFVFCVDLTTETDTPAQCRKQLPCQPGGKMPHTDLCSRYYLCGKDGKRWTMARCTSKHRYSFINRKTERCEASREPLKNCKVVCPDDRPQPPTKTATTTGRRTMQSTRAPPTATYSTTASHTQPLLKPHVSQLLIQPTVAHKDKLEETSRSSLFSVPS